MVKLNAECPTCIPQGEQQASQQSFDGKTIVYRWYVYVGRTRFVTWAQTEDNAREKTKRRPSLRGLIIDRVEPAPSGGVGLAISQPQLANGAT